MARTLRVAAAMAAALLAPSWRSAAASWQSSSGERPVILKVKEAGRLLVEKPGPKYPPLAKQNYIQGQVRIRILVNQEGKIAEAHVLGGHPFLAAAALAVLADWRYQPYLTPRGPEPFVTDVEMKFALRIKDPSTVPAQPEEDLKRQVRPPRVLSRPDNLPQASSIHIRVLVSAEGKALDVDPAPAFPVKFEAMREQFASWTFQPAQFGSLPVPWYLDVEVLSEDRPRAPARAR
jgi:TonB family protein